ncbi:sigma-70 family RNA polymerase sigma factor [Rhizobium sp. BK251]|uniref:sigma-70 family RNA polymerase sigma factor n=1 Tax=Rhizobium sp. BK251 TaxID=2512125 RepID=UPI00104DAA78|nr:sigma-70 family RNA polymerase sigma factor [Rhizobium sp. BK251]TCL66335.1 RNA polymerase sigma-70 factor (ECF subfamily) [Rhizobium sp. BK251]
MLKNAMRGSLCDDVVELIPALRAFARRFHRSQSDTDDLVQETLLKALSHLDHFHEGTRLKSWLFTIMRNTFCTRYRRALRESPAPHEGLDPLGAVDAVQELAIHAHEVEAACTRLAEPYRTTLELVAIEGRSYEEAAKYYNCAVGTIKSRMNRARRQLAVELADKALEH